MAVKRHQPIPDECDYSKGIPQCQAVEINHHDTDEYLHCARRVGHEGVHISAYGYEMDPKDVRWICRCCGTPRGCRCDESAVKAERDRYLAGLKEILSYDFCLDPDSRTLQMFRARVESIIGEVPLSDESRALLEQGIEDAKAGRISYGTVEVADEELTGDAVVEHKRTR